MKWYDKYLNKFKPDKTKRSPLKKSVLQTSGPMKDKKKYTRKKKHK